MIEYKHDNDGASIRMSGDLKTIIAEVAALVSLVYGSIHEKSEFSALMFRYGLMHTLTDKEVENVVWSGETPDGAMKINVDEDMMKILSDLVDNADE